MKLRPIIRSGLGVAALVAATALSVAIADWHWPAVLVLAVLAVGCAYPALTGRDPFNNRQRRRKHRHHSRRHASPAPVNGPQDAPPMHWQRDDDRA
jgi:hypothetical protein